MKAQQNQRVYAIVAHGGFSVYKRKRSGHAEKSKSLLRNKFTHVNARAARGCSAAPVWG